MPRKDPPVTDDGMTPVPTHALAALWHAIDHACVGMEHAQEIEKANHEYDRYCDCDHCPEVEDIDRRVSGIVIDAALAFRDACEEVYLSVAKPG
jgi:hypothetical protein